MAASSGPGFTIGSPAPVYSSATVHEAAGRTGALPPRIKPVAAGMTIRGPAFPVQCTPGNNIWLHRAVYSAPPGSVLVASVGGAHEYGYWGEILTVAALERRVAGLVIDGCIRDRDPVVALGFPVFSRGICIRGTGKDSRGGQFGSPVLIGDVQVAAGDLIVGDSDGVVSVRQADIGRVSAAAREREDKEASILRQLRDGARSIDLGFVGADDLG